MNRIQAFVLVDLMQTSDMRNKMNRKFKPIESAILRKIEELRMGAGHAGEMGDRGASLLRSQLDCWLAGLNDKVPAAFEEYAKDLERRNDPDWEKYQKLKAKFEK